MSDQLTQIEKIRVPIVPIGAAIAIGDTIIGTASSFTIGISRNKLPVWVLGKIDPMGYGRGTRLITGILNDVLVKGNSNVLATLIQSKMPKDSQAYSEYI